MNRPQTALGSLLGLLVCCVFTSGYSGAATKPLTVLTYNVCAKRIHLAERIPALMRILERSGADLIALQEVAPWFLKRLKKLAWVKKRYRLVFVQLSPNRPRGGLLFLSRFPVLSRRFLPNRKGEFSRGVLLAEFKVRGARLMVANVHLVSFLRAHRMRVAQLNRVQKLLQKRSEVLMLGDFNFGRRDRRETRALAPSYVDIWQELRPGQRGLTWNREKSPLARRGSFRGEPSRRLDRIRLKSLIRVPSWIRLLGNRPLPGHPGIFPSDHFGLLATIVRGVPNVRTTAR